MEKGPESHALLTKSNRYVEHEVNSSCDEEEWSDSCSSSYSESGSSVAEWEGLVDSLGELLYIDCHPQVAQQPKEDTSQNNKQQEPLIRTPTRRSTRGKLVRLIKRRESKRVSTRSYTSYTDAYAPSEIPTNNKVTFHDCQEGEVREVTLRIDPQNRAKFGRRATLVEALLGLNITTFSDGNRIMVAGFVPDGEAIKHRSIKIGDWLKCIDDTDITFQTINGILEYVTEPQEITLKLQRIGAIEVTKDPPINELFNQSEFVRQLTNPNSNEEEILCEILCNFPVGVLYLQTEGLNENGPEYEGVLYCFPKPMNRNVLCNSRGTFVTLNHLLPEVIKSKPNITSAIINGTLSHITYTSQKDKLLLLSFPDIRSSPSESLQMTREVIRCLEFCYQSVEKCFTTERLRAQVDRFFSRFFARLITSGTWPGAPQQVELQELNMQVIKQAPTQFENILPGAHYVTLPREAQMQLDDALNELEASDYRDWNEDPLNCQRLFTIIGSSFYHNGYMLASHLQWMDLVDIHCYCRQQGILHLSCTEPIRTLVLWREVFPSSCNRGVQDETSVYKTPEGKWYLLIVGNAKDLLMVLMEAGGCTSPSEENQGPDVFYVEEVQETLKHIQNMGISALADKWISLNSRPQVAMVDSTVNKQNKKMDFLGNIGFMKSSSPIPPKPPSPASKKPEVTSILKHRGTLNKSNINLSGSSSLFSSEDVSEDSASQGAHSELSDEPVLGRRATREKNNAMESDDSDSDWDTYRPNSEISGNFDISDLKQLSDLIPLKITAGEENMLYHYVHFDLTEGILMCPPNHETGNQIMDQIFTNFRKGCQSIHNIFQNTKRFKDMLAQDMAKLVVNKSLIAIKEHGLLFECFIEENGKKVGSVAYWIVGRLFYNPHPRELYVCYQDNSPQNLVEIAFRLGINAAG